LTSRLLLLHSWRRGDTDAPIGVVASANRDEGGDPMTRPTLRRLAVMLAAAVTFVAMNAGSANAASTHHTGTLPDGTTWTADVPSK
jgi:hypothetical protein